MRTKGWVSFSILLGLVVTGCAAANAILGTEEKKKEEPKEEYVSPPSEWRSVAGEYQTTYGFMTIVEDGQNFTGTYPGGRLDCVFNGKRYFEYDCTFEDGSGSGKAHVWYDGKTAIRGKWYNEKNVGTTWAFGPGDGPALDGSAPAGGGGGGGGWPCTRDTQCATDQLCGNGVCVVDYGRCIYDKDCRGGAKCIKSRCANSKYGSCSWDSDCGSGSKCKSATCI